VLFILLIRMRLWPSLLHLQ